ncbi:RNA-binding domain-containing protein [Rhizopogon vinicolor AM-OR11-026]|uniref:RNA-binding domain-containing protein n=1 Tax=Rhizopogon vinicolor AM-OR11-026 TaxID=1314800 RepID=A0A1B7N9D4_9AGAM|nr:RNA-binding domain-containing protein [Rhizopogon vinicolor AM-OR11-026]
MSLNEFLGDTTLGSWADEMDSLPSAPSIRTDGDGPRPGDRFGRRDDFASRPDRSFASPREDLPLPTQPPYTAYVANLAFDITESELESFFGPHETKSIKIIKDRDDKPKGFGYVEFAELDGLKDALAKTGSSLSGRTVRTSVAEPPKERSGFSGSQFEDDAKFSGNWRREGPPPNLQDTRDSSRRRFDGPPGDRMPPPPSVSDDVTDWRSSKLAKIPEPEAPSFKRRGSGFSTPEGPSAADTDEKWALGSKFKPSTEDPPSRFGSLRGSHDSQHARDPPVDEGDWRSGRSRTSRKLKTRMIATNSTPPTPQMGRRKLELLPRSSANSASPSPLSSPKMASNPGAPSAPKTSPFGAARPVDVSTREREIATRVEKDREALKDRVPHPMSRNSSRQATERTSGNVTRSPPPQVAPTPGSPRISHATPATSSNVRPSFSFAHAASTKKDVPNTSAEEKEDSPVDQITEQAAEVTV